MLMRYNSEVGQQLSTRSARIALALLGCACTLTPQAFAAVSYDEAVSGDLSNSGLSPTVVSVSQGQNQVFGSTGRQSGCEPGAEGGGGDQTRISRQDRDSPKSVVDRPTRR